MFDIFSKPHNHTDLAIQAQCYGGVFRVYSTKEFPGLQASTDLTLVCYFEILFMAHRLMSWSKLQQLARWGVRVNTREAERKRRKKGDAKSPSPLYAGTGKRKYYSADNADDPGDSDDCSV